MKHLTLLFFFLFIPTLLIVGCSETENITDTESETRQPQIDPMKIVVIPDENLAKSIREALELPEDADITAGQLATLEELWCSDSRSGPITDWTGLEYATQLGALYLRYCLLSFNPVTGERESIWDWDKESADLTPLVGLKNLYLDLSINGIKDLTPLKVLKNLKWLNLRENYIEDLTPLAELKQLTMLNLLGWGESNSNIKDITPLSGLKQLTSLSLDGNFDDITPLSGLKQLTWLTLHGDQISNITPLSGLKQLTSLTINGNVDDITPLSGLKQLTKLNLSDFYGQFDNDISDVTPLSGLKQLTFLDLMNNDISDVTPLTGLINLEYLDLRGNPIEDKPPLEELRKKNPKVVIFID